MKEQTLVSENTKFSNGVRSSDDHVVKQAQFCCLTGKNPEN